MLQQQQSSWTDSDLKLISKSWTQLRNASFTLSDSQLYTILQELFKGQTLFSSTIPPRCGTHTEMHRFIHLPTTHYKTYVQHSSAGLVSHSAVEEKKRDDIRRTEDSCVCVWQIRSEKTITANYLGMKSQGLCTSTEGTAEETEELETLTGRKWDFNLAQSDSSENRPQQCRDTRINTHRST